MFRRDAEVGGEVGSLAELALCSEGVQTGAGPRALCARGRRGGYHREGARRPGRALLAAGCPPLA